MDLSGGKPNETVYVSRKRLQYLEYLEANTNSIIETAVKEQAIFKKFKKRCISPAVKTIAGSGASKPVTTGVTTGITTVNNSKNLSGVPAQCDLASNSVCNSIESASAPDAPSQRALALHAAWRTLDSCSAQYNSISLPMEEDQIMIL